MWLKNEAVVRGAKMCSYMVLLVSTQLVPAVVMNNFLAANLCNTCYHWIYAVWTYLQTLTMCSIIVYSFKWLGLWRCFVCCSTESVVRLRQLHSLKTSVVVGPILKHVVVLQLKVMRQQSRSSMCIIECDNVLVVFYWATVETIKQLLISQHYSQGIHTSCCSILVSISPHVVGPQLCWLSPVDAHTVVLKLALGKITRLYSWYCAGLFHCVHKCLLYYMCPGHDVHTESPCGRDTVVLMSTVDVHTVSLKPLMGK